MEDKCSSLLDRLSELPSNLSHNILMLLPLRDMARTSVLSKHWRYQWVKVPQLVFEDDPMYVVSPEERYRYDAMKVFYILLQYHGPILKIILDMTAWPVCTALNSIIPFLSRNGIKELTLLMPNNYVDRHKLSPSTLSSLNLRYLNLSTFELRPPCIANFNNLVSLELSNVVLDPGASISSCPFLEILVLNILAPVNLLTIDAPNLKILHLEGGVARIGFMNTPLLKVLWLITNDRCYRDNSSSDFMSLLLSLPLLEDLFLTYEFLLEGGVDVEDSNRTNLYDPEDQQSTGASPRESIGCGFPDLNQTDEEGKVDGKQSLENRDGLKVLPFEFVALETCLEAACSCLDKEAKTLEQEAHPALDKLTSKISTLNLERVRQIKSRLVAISGRVQKVEITLRGPLLLGAWQMRHLLDMWSDTAHTSQRMQTTVGSSAKDVVMVLCYGSRAHLIMSFNENL